MRAARIGLMLVLLSVGAPAVWGQTSTTTPPTTMGSTTTVTFIHEDCLLPGGGIGACPTTTTRPPVSNPLAGFVCPILARLVTVFAPFRQFLQPILQLFGCGGTA